MRVWARNHGERGDNDNFFSHRDLWSSLEMGGMLHLLRAGILRFVVQDSGRL